METAAAAIVSFVFKLLDKYLILGDNYLGLKTRGFLFLLFSFLEIVIDTSLVQESIEHLLNSFFQFIRRDTPLTRLVPIQRVFTPIIILHSLISKILVYCGYSVMSGICLASLSLCGVVLEVLDQYGLIRLLVPCEEIQQHRQQKQRRDELARRAERGEDLSRSSDTSSSSSSSKHVLIEISAALNEERSFNRQEEYAISALHWTVYVTYLILARVFNTAEQQPQRQSFSQLQRMLVDFLVIAPLISRINSVKRLEIIIFIALSPLSYLLFNGGDDVGALVVYTVLVVMVAAFPRRLLLPVLFVIVSVLLNEAVMKLFISTPRVGLLVKSLFYLMELLMLMSFVRAEHGILVYASFYPAGQIVSLLVLTMASVANVESSVYADKRLVTEQVFELAGLAVMTIWEVQLVQKLSLATAEYLAGKRFQTQANPEEVHVNLLLEAVVREMQTHYSRGKAMVNSFGQDRFALEISWESDTLMQQKLDQMSSVSYQVVLFLLHFFVVSPTLQDGGAQFVILQQVIWNNPPQRDWKCGIISISLSVKSILYRGWIQQYLLAIPVNFILTLFPWKRNLLASIIPALFENYSSGESSSSSEETSLLQIVVNIFGILVGVGFISSNAYFNTLTKRARDISVPFLLYFLIFESTTQNSSYAKLLALNILISFGKDFSSLIKEL